MRVSDIQQVITGLLGQSGKNNSKELVPGSVITAFLKEIKGNMALLNYLGTDFTARLETDAPSGERLRFFVEGKKDGQTVLKLLGNEKESNNLILGGIVKDLGLPDETFNLKIVGEMLKEKMPLDPGVAGKISAFVRNLNIPENNLWIPVFMQNRNIPLNPQNYRQVAAFVNDIQYLQKDLMNLSDQIAKVASTADPKGELGQLAASIGRLLDQFNLNLQESPLSNVQKLSAIFGTLVPDATGGLTATNTAGPKGANSSSAEPWLPASPIPVKPFDQTAIEKPLTSGLASKTNLPEMANSSVTTGTTSTPATQSTQTTQTTSTVPTSSGASAFSTVQTSSTLADLLAGSPEVSDIQVLQGSPDSSQGEGSPEVKMRPDTGALPDKMISNGERSVNLDSLLDKLTLIMRENGDPEHKEVLKLIHDVSEKLDFIRNFNSFSQSGRENLMVMYSSVKFAENEAPLRLLVKYRQENREKVRDFTSCRMEIRLNTPYLGLVKCEVKVAEKNLTVRFVGASESTASFIDRFTGALVNRLADLKFNVNILPTGVSVEKENDFLSCENNDVPGLFQLNLKI